MWAKVRRQQNAVEMNFRLAVAMFDEVVLRGANR
jgi:hypothetical protein